MIVGGATTVVSVTNLSPRINRVFVSYFRGFTSNNAPAGMSARLNYTRGERDEELLAFTDSKVVVFGQRNRGD